MASSAARLTVERIRIRSDAITKLDNRRSHIPYLVFLAFLPFFIEMSFMILLFHIAIITSPEDNTAAKGAGLRNEPVAIND